MFNETAARRVTNFFERVLVHCDGEWAGKPFALLPWQRDMLRTLFGTLKDDGKTRQYRTCYVEVPRKAGKSTMAAGVALYLLFADGEMGAQVYGAAGDREQASIVFRVAAQMVRQSPYLRERCKVIDSTKRIVIYETASFYRAIPAEAAGAHGYNASGIIVDEVHVQPNRDLLDVLTTSTGARRQPLTFHITTAGYDRHSICWELHEYALKVKSGVIQDDTFLPVVYSVPDDADWTDPAVWAIANPSLGVTPKMEHLQEECSRAKATPAYENTFRRLHLNQWVRQDTRWLPLAKWDACGTEPLDLEALKGRDCYAGLDLASTTDIAALVLVFPSVESEGEAENAEGEPQAVGRLRFDVLPFFFIPEDSMIERSRRDRVPYDTWVNQGYIIATEGNVIDYKAIMAKFDELAQLYHIREVGFDRWGATQLVQDMQAGGLEVVPIGQGFASMSAPTKELLNLVLAGRIRHGGNPTLRWQADNMVVSTDPAGNIKPNKAKSTEKIDGMVALIMAIDRATRHEHEGSCYEEHGVLVL
jgi:phage terminase large subunit-like protein